MNFGDDIGALIMIGTSSLDEDGEGSPDIVGPITDNSLKFCALSLRMAPRSVPTMSEWGLVGFAAFAGIAGFWFIRRRQLAA